MVALVISSVTCALYIHWRPFERESDDNLAILTQVSLSFTLLAALLKKVHIDEDERYDSNIFGLALVFLNFVSIGMLIISQLSKTFFHLFEGLLGKKHSHQGSLIGMNEEETRDKEGFETTS